MNYLKETIKMYLSSFKNKSILLFAMLNILFILLTAAMVRLITFFSKGWMEIINRIDLSNITFQSEAQLSSTISSLKGFALFSLFAAILFILFLELNWSFFQSIIYNNLLKKKFTIKYFEKFLLLNIIWFIPLIALLALVIIGGKIEYLIISSIIIILAFLHFSFILYVLFTKENKISKIKTALKIGITKLHYFIIPYILVLITYIIINQLNLLNIPNMVMLIIFIIFFSWLQSYAKDVITSIKC